MSTIEQKELQSSNGWQNIGICKKFARKNVPFKLRALWMELVEESFGYGYLKTKRISQDELAKMFGVTKQTLNDQLKKLEELKLIEVIGSNEFVVGGGTKPNAYAPCYPKGFGKLYRKESSISGSEVVNETTIKPEEPEVEWDKEKNIDF